MRALPFAQALIRNLRSGVKLTCAWGGVGAGKSVAEAQLALEAALTRVGWNEEDQQEVPLQILMTMRTMGDIKSILLPRCKEVFGDLARFVNDSEHCRWEFFNGNIVTYKDYKMYSTMDKSQNSFEGRDYHILISDETQHHKPTFYEHSFARTRLVSKCIRTGEVHDSQLFWLGRPCEQDGYLREAKRLRAGGMRVSILYPPTSSNRYLTSDYLDSLRASVSTEDEFIALTQSVPGALMAAKTSIYSVFESQHNLIDVAPGGPTWACMDFNVDQPSVLYIQERVCQGRRQAVIVGEWCPDEEVLVTALVEQLNSAPWPLAGIICDPAGNARNVAAHRSIVDTLRLPKAKGGTGLPVYSKVYAERRAVELGISRVRARICNYNGDRDILVLRELWDTPKFRRGIKHTILGYQRDPETRTILTGAKGDHADHIADALRYYVIERLWDNAIPTSNVPTGPEAPWRITNPNTTPSMGRI